ncbi:MAG: RNA-binding protein [Pseudomonadota bacterium]
MGKTIYVGNLPFSASEEQVSELFAAFGAVTAVKLVNDRETGRFRGFAFVEMGEGAEAAIRELDGKEFGGRALRVNEAKERAPRSGGGMRRRSPYRTA